MIINGPKNKDYARKDAEIAELKVNLSSAVSRIKDMLMQDDGQAWKEAEKFVESMDKASKQGE